MTSRASPFTIPLQARNSGASLRRTSSRASSNARPSATKTTRESLPGTWMYTPVCLTLASDNDHLASSTFDIGLSPLLPPMRYSLILTLACHSTGAQILHEYKPYGASSKAVDFCVCIKPDASSAEAQAIEALTLSRPGFPINHTDWGNFNKHPIALSVETKRQAEWDRALLQIGTWHSSQWRALQRGSDAHMAGMGCLPGIIVQGHSWYFVASTVETGKAKLYHKLDIGGTDSHFRVYKLVVALQYLGEWIEGVYWPAFKQAVLSMAPTT